MLLEEHLSLLEGELSNSLPSLMRLNASDAGDFWKQIHPKFTALAKHHYLINGDTKSFQRALDSNARCRVALLQKLNESEPTHRLRCSGLYETTLEAMAMGQFDQAVALTQLANETHNKQYEHITDFQYGRLLGVASDSNNSLSDDPKSIIHALCSHADSLFSTQAQLIDAILNQDATEAQQYFEKLIQEKQDKIGNDKLSDFRAHIEAIVGDPDAEEDAVYDLEDMEPFIDLELLAFAALSRLKGIDIALQDYPFCPKALQQIAIEK